MEITDFSDVAGSNTWLTAISWQCLQMHTKHAALSELAAAASTVARRLPLARYSVTSAGGRI
jgi:hypothetical protein